MAYLVCFFAAGIWMLRFQPEAGDFILNDPIVRNALGIFSILVGVLGLAYLGHKVLLNKPAVIMDEQGISNHTNARYAGKILWKDIRDVQEKSVRVSLLTKKRFILIFVHNPDEYIEAQPGKMVKRMMNFHRSQYGTFFVITPQGLDITFESLKLLIDQKLIEYQMSLM